jgi:hypothetical protein
MPTGYTADVADGKVTDFRTFALRCARNFGATIMQRDDPASDPPKHREPSRYAEGRVAECRARLAALNAMTLADAEREATAQYEKALADEATYRAERRATRQRYEAMLVKVRAWEPPTAAHVGMREFMEKQLVESIDFDCHEYPSRVMKLKGAAWLEREKEHEMNNLARNAEQAAEEIARCDGANAWIDALYASLAEQPETATPAEAAV